MTSSDGLIIATRLTDDTTDTRWYEPMISDAAAAVAAMAAAVASGAQIGLVLADAGYLSEANLTCDGPDRLIATGKRRDLEKRARQAAAARTPRTRRGDRRHGRPARDPRRHRRLPAARPHRRDPARPHQAQHAAATAVRPRNPQSSRRMDLRLRRPQPDDGHHQRPPHHPGPRQPRRLTTQRPASQPTPAISTPAPSPIRQQPPEGPNPQH